MLARASRLAGLVSAAALGPSTAESSLVLSQSSVNTGVSVTVTVTVKDISGAPMAGESVLFAVTGSNNTLGTNPATTNASGVATCTVSSSTAEAKTVSATCRGRAVGANQTLTVTGAGGQAPVVSAVTASGLAGDAVSITVNDSTGCTGATIGGTSVGSFAVADGTHVTGTVPSGLTLGSVVDVTVTNGTGTGTLAGGFVVAPQKTTTYVSHDFEDGTLGGFSKNTAAGCTVAASTDVAYAGTKSCKCFAVQAAGDQAAEIYYNLGSNLPLTNTNGVCIRFRLYVTSATLGHLTGGSAQIKAHLFRRTGGSGQQGFIMGGLGAAFPSSNNHYQSCVDYAIKAITGGNSPAQMGDGVWLTVQYWCNRKNNTGRVIGWYNGAKAFDVTDSNMGEDSTGAGYDYVVRLGIAYQAGSSGDNTLYLDDVAIADGYIA